MTVVNIVAKATRLPRVVRMLAQHGGDALKHKVENGKLVFRFTPFFSFKHSIGIFLLSLAGA